MATHRVGSLPWGAIAGITVLAAAACWPQAARAGDIGATLHASPAAHKGACPATITFTGTISSPRATKVQYRFVRSDGASAPVQTIELDRHGRRNVETTWTLGGDRLPSFEGWQAIEIVYPSSVTSNRAEFQVTCVEPAPATERPPSSRISADAIGAVATRLRRPDLTVTLSAPLLAVAGMPLRREVTVEARNAGSAAVPGTLTDPDAGYMIDVVLSSDEDVPPGAKTYSDRYSEDVLLRGGRVSRTVDLAPGESHRFTEIGDIEIPADTPPGRYFICARVDSMDKVAEADEGNNVRCRRVRIRQRPHAR